VSSPAGYDKWTEAEFFLDLRLNLALSMASPSKVSDFTSPNTGPLRAVPLNQNVCHPGLEMFTEPKSTANGPTVPTAETDRVRDPT